MKIKALSTLNRGWNSKIDWNSTLLIDFGSRTTSSGGPVDVEAFLKEATGPKTITFLEMATSRQVREALTLAEGYSQQPLFESIVRKDMEKATLMPWSLRVMALQIILEQADMSRWLAAAPALLKLMDDIDLGIPEGIIYAHITTDAAKALNITAPLFRQWEEAHHAKTGRYSWPKWLGRVLDSEKYMSPDTNADSGTDSVLLWLPSMASLRPAELEVLHILLRQMSLLGIGQVLVAEPYPEAMTAILSSLIGGDGMEGYVSYSSLEQYHDSLEKILFDMKHVHTRTYLDVMHEAQAMMADDAPQVSLLTSVSGYLPVLEIISEECSGFSGMRLKASVRDLLDLYYRQPDSGMLRELSLNPRWNFSVSPDRKISVLLTADSVEELAHTWYSGSKDMSDSLRSRLKSTLDFVNKIKELHNTGLHGDNNMHLFMAKLGDLVRQFAKKGRGQEELEDWLSVMNTLNTLVELAEEFGDSTQLMTIARQMLENQSSGYTLPKRVYSYQDPSYLFAEPESVGLWGLTSGALSPPEYLHAPREVYARQPDWMFPASLTRSWQLVPIFSSADRIVLSAPATQNGKPALPHALHHYFSLSADNTSDRVRMHPEKLEPSPAFDRTVPDMIPEYPDLLSHTRRYHGKDAPEDVPVIKFSASEATSYMTCPMRHFWQHGIGDQEASASTWIMHRGSVVHYLMEWTLRDYTAGDDIADILTNHLKQWKGEIEARLRPNTSKSRRTFTPFIPDDQTEDGWWQSYFPSDYLAQDLMWIEDSLTRDWPSRVAELLDGLLEVPATERFLFQGMQDTTATPPEELERIVDSWRQEILDDMSREKEQNDDNWFYAYYSDYWETFGLPDFEERWNSVRDIILNLSQRHGMLDIGDHTWRITGRFDALHRYEDNSDSGETLVDYKYSKASNASPLQAESQGALYAVSLLSEGRRIEGVRFMYLNPSMAKNTDLKLADKGFGAGYSKDKKKITPTKGLFKVVNHIYDLFTYIDALAQGMLPQPQEGSCPEEKCTYYHLCSSLVFYAHDSDILQSQDLSEGEDHQ